LEQTGLAPPKVRAPIPTVQQGDASSKNGRPYRETQTQLFRPQQVRAFRQDLNRLQALMDAPSYVGGDRAQAHKDYMRMDAQVEAQTPHAYGADEVDIALKRELVLREQFTAGMPTAAEMRRTPAGAIDKHTSWEQRNKPAILEWKNIRRRLHASGALDGFPEYSTDVANVEVYRPTGGSGELNMDNTLIPSQLHFLPPAGAGQAVVMSEDQEAFLQTMDPKLFGRMALLTNEQRKLVLSTVDEMLSEQLPKDPPKVKK